MNGQLNAGPSPCSDTDCWNESPVIAGDGVGDDWQLTTTIGMRPAPGYSGSNGYIGRRTCSYLNDGRSGLHSPGADTSRIPPAIGSNAAR